MQMLNNYWMRKKMKYNLISKTISIIIYLIKNTTINSNKKQKEIKKKKKVM